MPFRQIAKRYTVPGCIMDTSGEPVSKYRVMVFIPGRLEYILISGAPTYLGRRSLFSSSSFEGGSLKRFEPQGISFSSFPMPRRSN